MQTKDKQGNKIKEKEYFRHKIEIFLNRIDIMEKIIPLIKLSSISINKND